MDYRWDDIRLFLALHRRRTLAGAAVELGLDGSTVSRRLAAFEAAARHTLFERTRDGLHPTAAAEALLPIAVDLERAALRFDHELDTLDRAPEGVVRMTMPPAAAEIFIVPLLPALLALHPKLRLELEPSQRYVDLVRGEADLALRGGATPAGDVTVTRLFEIEFAILASPSLAARLGVVQRFDALPWITWGDAMAQLPAAQWVAPHLGERGAILRSTSLQAQLAAVHHGLGVALVPLVCAASLGLARVALSDALLPAAASWPVEELWLACATSRRHLPRVAAVWEFLLAEVNRTIGDGTGNDGKPRGLRRGAGAVDAR